MHKLIPNSFFSSAFPSTWNDDEENWLMPQVAANGLSISEDEKHIYVEAAVPGIDPKDVDVTFHEGNVWIRAEKNAEEKNKDRKYYRQASTSFQYRVAIPGDIDMNVEPEATYKNGVMTVRFAKSPKAQPKKIEVKA